MQGDAPRVLIIGAGAAGLAAAARLSQARVAVTLIEARERIGGRIRTIHESGWPAPIEGGAEFIHGAAAETQTAITALHLTTEEVADKHWRFCRNGLVPAELESAWRLVSERLDALGSDDLSFAAFLRRDCRDLSADHKSQVLSFVEGFNAADPEIVSAKWLRESDEQTGPEEGIRRIRGGYAQLLDYFLANAFSANVASGLSTLRLGRQVTSVRWRHRFVEVEARTDTPIPEKHSGQAAIVTLPLGVLQAVDGEFAVRFHPDLAEKRRAIEQLRMGQVVKLVLLFRTPFWKTRGPSDLEFLHTPADAFVTWWTTDLALPMLTGWSGGPKAGQLSRLDEVAILDDGLSTLAESFGMRFAELKKLLVRHRVFDWQAEPFSRGAYAYVPAGGFELAGELGAPVHDTLFFAGEATHPRLTGTVEGAVASGVRAADEVVAALDVPEGLSPHRMAR